MLLQPKGIFTKKENRSTFLIRGKRTPFGKFGGSLSKLTPIELLLSCSKSTLEANKISPKLIDQVIVGNVIPSTPDCLYLSRHLALKLGANITTPGYSLNRLCGSGVQAILDAQSLIDRGAANCILVAGVEQMSMTPHLTYGARFGTKYGDLKNVDLLWNALTDKHINISMGETSEKIAHEFNISRQECDKIAFESHQKAALAYEQKHLQNEISSINLKKHNVTQDEHMRSDIQLENLQKLPASFAKDGIITAGNASGIVDGAASVLICSEQFCKQNNLSADIEVLAGSVIGVEPSMMGLGPIDAVNLLLEETKLKLDQIDLIELNEAFSSQVVACVKKLNLNPEKVNVWGGAIALGHPLGATGVRITNTLSYQLNHYKKTYGIATACIGGGQGIAILLKNYAN